MERAHFTISQGVKTQLIGAGLDIKFWPYVFMHLMCIYNAFPGKGQDASLLFLSTGKKYNFQNMRVFGC